MTSFDARFGLVLDRTLLPQMGVRLVALAADVGYHTRRDLSVSAGDEVATRDEATSLEMSLGLDLGLLLTFDF